MEAPKFFKEFDRKYGLEGPLCCRNGVKAEIWQSFNEGKLIGMHYSVTGEPFAAEWNSDGKYSDIGFIGSLDLVMLPLTFIDNLPVYVGSVIADNLGYEVEANIFCDFTPGHGWKWPVNTPIPADAPNTVVINSKEYVPAEMLHKVASNTMAATLMAIDFGGDLKLDIDAIVENVKGSNG